MGIYDSPEEAARAYDRAAIEYRGRDAITNFPLSMYEEELRVIAQRAPLELVAEPDAMPLKKRKLGLTSSDSGKDNNDVAPYPRLTEQRRLSGKTTSSKYRGVCITPRGKWQAQIR